MEIPDLNLINYIEAGMKCLQNPSLLSKLSIIHKLPQLYSFWTFGALIIAIFATFTNIFIKINLFIHQLHLKLLTFTTTFQNSHPQQIFNDDDDFEFDFSDEDTPSSVADSDDEELDSEEAKRVDEVFREEGSGGGGFNYYCGGQNGNFGDFSSLSLRRRTRLSWSDFSAGKSVVQLWDSFGLGLDFEEDELDYGSEIAIWDLDRDVKLSSGRRVAAAAEKMVVTAEVDGENGGVGFGTYDSRVGVVCPAVYAAWRPR